MKNVNEILKGEQIDMLRKDLSDSDLFTLFLMNVEEKINFLSNFRNEWVASRQVYFDLFSNYSEDFAEYKKSKDSDSSNLLYISERMHDLFMDMQRCDEFIDIYNILIANIYNSAS